MPTCRSTLPHSCRWYRRCWPARPTSPSAPGARPQVRPRRQVPSYGHSLLLQASFGTGFADPQCGFKAIRRDHARDLLPLTRDDDWFFDTQLLRLALRAGLRIREIAVNHARDARRTAALLGSTGALRRRQRRGSLQCARQVPACGQTLTVLPVLRQRDGSDRFRPCSYPPARPTLRRRPS